MLNIIQHCQKCKQLSTHKHNDITSTITCRCGYETKESKTNTINKISYDSCDLSSSEVKDWESDSGKPLLYFLVESSIDGTLSSLKQYENNKNIHYIPLRKKSGKGLDCYFHDNETDFKMFNDVITKALLEYKQKNEKTKYWGYPENLGCNSKLPNRFKEHLTKKIEEML